MGKIVMFNMVSVDGYFAGEDGNIDWHVVDDEFNKYAVETLKNIDTILFGRLTYQLFESFWPIALKDPKTGQEDRVIAQAIDDATKIVFSTTLDQVTWNNSKLCNYIVPEDIEKLKQKDGKDIVIYGSGMIVRELTNLGLIDEYRFMVAPVILGKGKSLFENVNKKNLKLAETREFKSSGNVLLSYRA
jgi:dihydrofolate reductase